MCLGPYHYCALLGQTMKRRGNGTKVPNKSTIESSKSEKRPDLSGGRGSRPLPNGLDLAVVDAQPVLGNNVPKEDRGRGAKGAFGKIAKESLAAETSEDEMKMVYMVLKCLRKDQNVVKIDNNELSQILSEHVVHEPHESRGGISEPKRHHKPLI